MILAQMIEREHPEPSDVERKWKEFVKYAEAEARASGSFITGYMENDKGEPIAYTSMPQSRCW